MDHSLLVLCLEVSEHRIFSRCSGDLSALKITAFDPSTGQELTELRKYILEIEVYT